MNKYEVSYLRSERVFVDVMAKDEKEAIELSNSFGEITDVQHIEDTEFAIEQKYPNTGDPIEKWLGHKFESSTGLTPEFANFSKEIKQQLKKKLPQGAKLKSFSRGHFEWSVFIERDGNYLYLSCSDVRYFQDEWYNNLLIRLCNDEYDYTGGRNEWTTWTNLSEKIDQML